MLRRKQILAAAFLAAAVLAGGTAGAAPPSNDNFGSATAISSLPFTDTVDTSEATLEVGEPSSCGSGESNSVWYSMTLAAPATVGLNTFTSDFDTVLAVYEGSLPGLTLVECNDDTPDGLQAAVAFNALAGTTYSIRVAGYGGGFGQLVLHALVLVPPANDSFANAVPATSVPFSATADTRNATFEAGESPTLCDPGTDRTVWYDLTLPSDTRVAVDTIGSTFDTVVGIWTGSSLATASQLACNDDTNGLQSLVRFWAHAGTTYHIQIGGFGGSSGDLTVNIATIPVTETKSYITGDGLLLACGSPLGLTGGTGLGGACFDMAFEGSVDLIITDEVNNPVGANVEFSDGSVVTSSTAICGSVTGLAVPPGTIRMTVRIGPLALPGPACIPGVGVTGTIQATYHA